jgi:hypothetical protein
VVGQRRDVPRGRQVAVGSRFHVDGKIDMTFVDALGKRHTTSSATTPSRIRSAAAVTPSPGTAGRRGASSSLTASSPPGPATTRTRSATSSATTCPSTRTRRGASPSSTARSRRCSRARSRTGSTRTPRSRTGSGKTRSR